MNHITATYFSDITLTSQFNKGIEKTDSKEGQLHSVDLTAHNVVKVEQVTKTITRRGGTTFVVTDIIATDDEGITTTLSIFHK